MIITTADAPAAIGPYVQGVNLGAMTITSGQLPVKTTVFVKDLKDFAAINAAYEAFFTEHQATFPARSCVEVARLPKDAGVEIEAIAFAR
ncbi:MAG: Rid family hydrolase [Klebsiella aerogenes]|nr:Rid family hydrolase [Klebsiella aerogenes]